MKSDTFTEYIVSMLDGELMRLRAARKLLSRDYAIIHTGASSQTVKVVKEKRHYTVSAAVMKSARMNAEKRRKKQAILRKKLQASEREGLQLLKRA